MIKPLLYGTHRLAAEKIAHTVESAVGVFLAAYRSKAGAAKSRELSRKAAHTNTSAGRVAGAQIFRLS